MRPAPRPFAAALACLACVAVFACAACDACGGPDGPGGEEGIVDDGLPDALAEMTEFADVVPFDGWMAEGTQLYRASWAVPDQSSSRIVGVDGEGELVEGPALMERFGELSPRDLASRAFGVLLDEHGHKPLSPGEEPSFASEAEWELVTEPRMEDGTLIFYGYQGEMSPTLVEHRLDSESFKIETTPVRQVLLDRGEIVALGGPLCVVLARCGCWDGCARAEVVQVPEGRRGTHRLVEGEDAGRLLERREECLDEQCFQVCRADTADAHCDPGALSLLDEECGESCPPSEAPYHCETPEEGCRRVEHPSRQAAAAGAQ